MIYDLFSVFDAKAKVFCKPFTSENISTAIRAFKHAANDPNTDLGRYPEDFSLFHIGTFNDETCKIDTIPHFQLATALSLVE